MADPHPAQHPRATKSSSRAARAKLGPTLKYLASGFAIGICLGLLLLATAVFAALPPSKMAPTSTEVASRVPSTPTLPPSPTSTWLPQFTSFLTPTPDSLQKAVDSGQLFFFGPLTDDQQIGLYQSSLGYIAPTSKQSIFLAKELNGLEYGNPSNTCGPLAISILRDAGLVNPEINPHDFWLLNPNIASGRTLLNTVFPANRYDDFRFKTPLNKFDWTSFYLQPGDFMYIYHGTGGNFDHMLVVNRVDSQLRAYAVTNFDTPTGFVMNEVLLYDPAAPTAGIFSTWTQTPFAILGSTGFGGFEIWRLHKP